MVRRILAAVAALIVVMAGCVSGPAGAAARTAPAAIPAPACADIAPSPQPPGTPVRILALGDSITAACQWQVELSRLLTEAGVPHVITTYAVGGTACSYWPGLIGDVVAAARPDLAYVYCGTNDGPDAMCYGESCTGWAFRVIVETIHGYRSPAPAIVPALVGYSDATLSPAWLLSNEPRTNDTLWTNMRLYLPPRATGWFAGVADLQQMPGTAVYLDGDGCNPSTTTCAVHPNAFGMRVVGRIMYDAAAAGMGWPAATSLGEPVLCGMAGHRIGYPRPAYTPCP